MNENNGYEINLIDIIPAYLKKIWIPIVCAVLMAVFSFVYTTQFVTPTYTSAATLYIINRQNSTGVYSQSDLSAYESLTQDYMQLIKTTAILDRVIEEQDLDLSYEQLRGRVSVSNPAETRYIYVKVKDENPTEAKRIVDAITVVTKNYITELMKSEQVEIIETGSLPTAPSSPNVVKSIFVFALIGFVIPSAFIVLLYILDDKIVSADQVEERLGMNVIGRIPYCEQLEENRRKEK